MGWWDGSWGGYHWWMGIFPLIFLVLFVLIFFGGAGWTLGRGGSRAPTAREILDRRYAEGELSREDYQRMRKDLE